MNRRQCLQRRRCRACAILFLPAAEYHVLCWRCWHWHRIGLHLAALRRALRAQA
jgi:hypothetical protein